VIHSLPFAAIHRLLSDGLATVFVSIVLKAWQPDAQRYARSILNTALSLVTALTVIG